MKILLSSIADDSKFQQVLIPNRKLIMNLCPNSAMLLPSNSRRIPQPEHNLTISDQYTIGKERALNRNRMPLKQNRDLDKTACPLEKSSSNSFKLKANRTCAFLSRPPVDPPKIGEGVSGFRVGSTQGALGAAAAGAAGVAASALTTTDARLETGATARQTAEREDATDVLMRLQMAIPGV